MTGRIGKYEPRYRICRGRIVETRPAKLCDAPECGHVAEVSGYCHLHYNQRYKHSTRQAANEQ